MGWASRTFRRYLPSAAAWATKYALGEAELFPPRRTFALGPLHEKIKRQFPYRDGVFFEVGANDGLTQSNTAYLERYRGWRGLLVEPLPAQYARCVANRPRSKVFNVALVSEEVAGGTVDIRYSNLMSVIDDPAHSMISAQTHLELGRRFLYEDSDLSGRAITVPATSVSRILDEAGATRIDFFSLDVEGYEIEVLKGIDFSRHRPCYFLVEVREKELLDAFLEPRGYRRIAQWSHHDFLYEDTQPS